MAKSSDRAEEAPADRGGEDTCEQVGTDDAGEGAGVEDSHHDVGGQVRRNGAAVDPQNGKIKSVMRDDHRKQVAKVVHATLIARRGGRLSAAAKWYAAQSGGP